MAYQHIPIPKLEPLAPFGLDASIQWIATCLAGTESLVADELKSLGAKSILEGHRHLRVEGRFSDLLTMLYESRLTVRFLVPLAEGRLRKPQDLYKKAAAIPWEQWLLSNQSFAVDANINSPWFKQNLYPALVVKDALVDRLRDKTGKRPNVDKNQPHLKIHLRIDEQGAYTIALDVSGFSLQRRGYRKAGGPAPISEILAAVLVKISGWSGENPLLDPFCGGGTLLIEAIRAAKNIPSAALAPPFCVFHWPNFSKEAWDDVKHKAHAKEKDLETRVIGSDISGTALSLGQAHAQEAGLDHHIEWIKADARLLVPAQCPAGTILTNPPYGERIDIEDLEALYGDWGRQLKNHYADWEVWVLSAHKEALKRIGFKHHSQHQFVSGTLPVWFRGFQLYSGSRKSSNQDSDK